MLENLLSLVKEHAGDAIINNPAIPNERNDDAIQEAYGSILGGLQGAFAGNGAEGIAGFFGNQPNVSSSAISQNIQGGFIESLMSKFGVNGAQASSIAGSLIPTVLQNFVQKTNDPNDNSFDLQDIMGNLAGGQGNGGGLMDLVKGFMK